MSNDTNCRPSEASVILKMKRDKGTGDEIGVAKMDSDSEGWVTIELRTGHVIKLSPITAELIRSGTRVEFGSSRG